MKKKMKGLVLSSLLLGGLILSTATSCGKDNLIPSNPNPDVNLPDNNGEGGETQNPTEKKDFTVKTTCGKGGLLTVVNDSGKEGDTVSFVIVPEGTYSVDTITINGKKVANDVRSFVAIAGENTIAVTFTETKGSVKLNVGENGKAKVSTTNADVGTEVTVSTTPDRGYIVDTIKHNGTDITVNEAGKAKFNLVAGENTVDVTFKADPDYIPEDKPSGVTNLFFTPGEEMLAAAADTSSMYYYLFGGTGPKMEWPGKECAKLTDPKLDQSVWTVPVDFTQYEQIIFTFGQNGPQIADLPLSQIISAETVITTEGTELGGIDGKKTIHSFKFLNTEEYFASKGIAMGDLVIPDLPEHVIKEYGTYHFELTLTAEWKEKMTATTNVNMHYWSSSEATPGSEWPGTKMTLKEGTDNVYTADLKVNQNTGILFDLCEEGEKAQLIQTKDVVINYKDAGNDATVKVTLGASEQVKDGDPQEGEEQKYKTVTNYTLKYAGAEAVNKQRIYFQDAPYWHDGNTNTSIIRYNAEGAIVGEEAGLELTYLNWGGDRSIRYIDLTDDQLANVTQFQFSRFISEENKDKQDAAKTVKIDMPDFSKEDMYAVQDIPAYEKDGKLAEVVKAKFVDKDTFVKTTPYVKKYGTYHIYVEAPEDWAINGELGIHYWGTEVAAPGESFPNARLNKVNGTNLFSIDLGMSTDVGFIIAKTDCSAQTTNIKLTEEQLEGFGTDANILVKVTPNTEKPKEATFEVTKYTPGTPTPEPEPIERPDAATFKYLVKVTPEMNFTEFNAHAYLFYKEGEQDFKNHDWPGEKMTLTSTDNVYGFTPREDDVNASKYTTIIFNNNAGKQTADISLVDRTDEFKMLTITGEKEGKFEGKWTNLAGAEPEKPVAKEYGTYKIYVRDNANWAIDNKLGIHHWGSATKPENPAKDAFPNSTMKLVEGEKNLYEIDLLMKENVGFIIAKTDKSAQTKDIKLTTEQLDGFGKDASIEIVIGKADPNANNNYNFEVKAYTPGTPTPEPEKPAPVEKTTFTLNVPAGWDDKGIQIRIYFYSEADEKGYMDQITLAKSETDHAERFEITFELPNNVNYIKLEQITLVPNQDPVYGAKTNAFEVATARKEGKTLITVADDNTVTITKIEVAA